MPDENDGALYCQLGLQLNSAYGASIASMPPSRLKCIRSVRAPDPAVLLSINDKLESVGVVLLSVVGDADAVIVSSLVF